MLQSEYNILILMEYLKHSLCITAQRSQRIIFKPILTTFSASNIFEAAWPLAKISLSLKTKQPIQNLNTLSLSKSVIRSLVIQFMMLASRLYSKCPVLKYFLIFQID